MRTLVLIKGSFYVLLQRIRPLISVHEGLAPTIITLSRNERLQSNGTCLWLWLLVWLHWCFRVCWSWLFGRGWRSRLSLSLSLSGCWITIIFACHIGGDFHFRSLGCWWTSRRWFDRSGAWSVLDSPSARRCSVACCISRCCRSCCGWSWYTIISITWISCSTIFQKVVMMSEARVRTPGWPTHL